MIKKVEEINSDLEITINSDRIPGFFFLKLLLSERTQSSAVYLCFSLFDIVDLGKFCFGCDGGQRECVCAAERKAEEYHVLIDWE